MAEEIDAEFEERLEAARAGCRKEWIEDYIDTIEMKRAMADPETIPWELVKARLGL